MTTDGSLTEELDLFYEEVRRHDASPLWTQERPSDKTLAYMWKYKDFRPLLLRATELVPVGRQAERRVLVFNNPGLPGKHSATSTLLANLQIILPGEVAPSHRHTAAALRLIVEGKGAYTAVQGEKSYMEPGDFVTTPNWTWHDHGHEGDGPMVWVDGLDVPMVQSFEAMFQEQFPDDKQPLTKPDDASMRLYSGNMRPTWVNHDQPYSPLINYKFDHVYEVLTGLAKESDGSPFDGISLEYTNPLTGRSALPTMACFAQMIQAGQHTKAHRHTGSTIYCVIKGKGHSIIDGQRFDWEDKDTFVAPSWSWHEHVADQESVLFMYNDWPILEPLGLFREEELTDNGGFQQVTGTFKPGPIGA